MEYTIRKIINWFEYTCILVGLKKLYFGDFVFVQRVTPFLCLLLPDLLGSPMML